MATARSVSDLPLDVNYQVPNSSLHAAFGELNITPRRDRLDILTTILMEPTREGSQTGVAMDGSLSMQNAFGEGWIYAPSYDRQVIERLIREGKAHEIESDGQRLLKYTQVGWDELLRLKYLIKTENEVQPIARDVIPYLAEKIDADGGTTAIYWACGAGGDRIEEIGDLTADTARTANYKGPKQWGAQTHLLPALRYFVERFANANWGFYVFVTDGRLDDLEAVKKYTADLARRIHAGKAKPVKGVLIGVGTEVDESQMEQLDDLPDELDLPVDIWDHKIASSMRDLRDIFAEVVDENAMVAPTGRVLDDKGTVVATYADGVPSLLRFSVPREAGGFTLDIAGNQVSQKFF
jgi:hypothetical protein